MKELIVIGLNSGTSLDGVDAAICLINFTGKPKINFLNGLVLPYETIFKKKLQAVLTTNTINLKDLCLINAQLGDYFLEATLNVIKETNLTINDINLIGSHGQTFWHSPNPILYLNRPTCGSLQLGDPSIIAQKTKIPVVCDFRVQDICAQGQGAPLVAYLDKILFGNDNIATGILNIGGIANITFINSSNNVELAFDTGPGNMIIDHAAKLLFDLDFDQDGVIASKATYDQKSLNSLMQHNYFSKYPPKTTGREEFGYTYANSVINFLEHQNLDKETIMATVTAFTAYSIAQAYENFIKPHENIERLIVAGGGAYNKTLIAQLQNFITPKTTIKMHDEYNIPVKYKEAILFALLAYTRYYNLANNIPKVTGAINPVSMGKIINPNCSFN